MVSQAHAQVLYAAASVCIAGYDVELVVQGCGAWVHTWLFYTHTVNMQ